ncbi:MAG: class I SAM-dependent methyltransferase [Gemmatimonadales bacterium]|nr:class I SAM-dependent methyltransferase [Gemmatimonadales bacterium]
MKTTAYLLYLRLLRMAVTIILRGRLVDGLKLLIAPVGYWRVLPNAVVWEELERLGPARVLDLSSPKPLTLLVGERWPVEATDLDDPWLLRRWKPCGDLLGLSRITWAYADGRALTHASGAFDAAYSISVIEHIPGDGDTEALAEMARVVRPGGVVVVEVPLRHVYAERGASTDSKGAPGAVSFYERYYDTAALERRLHAPTLRLRRRLLLGEGLPIDPWIAQPVLWRPLRLLLLPFEPALALLNYFAREDRIPGRPLAAILVFDRIEAPAA